MTIQASKYPPYLADIQHVIDPTAVTYRTRHNNILLRYTLDTTTQTALKPLLLELALHGTRQSNKAFTGKITEEYSSVIKSVRFYLSVNIQPRRRYCGLYVKITPIEGHCRGYHILCDSTPEEIQQLAERYIKSNPIPYTWRGVFTNSSGLV